MLVQSYSLIWECGLAKGGRLTPLELRCLVLAAVCHDLDHPGLGNIYQINAETPLALLYNDQSPLESHHSEQAFSLLLGSEPRHNSLASAGAAAWSTLTHASAAASASSSTAPAPVVAVGCSVSYSTSNRAPIAAICPPDRNLLAGLSHDQFRVARNIVVQLILATDLANHYKILRKFEKASRAFDWKNSEHRLLVCTMQH